MIKPTGELTYIGEDDWSRKLFKTKSGIVLVDVDGELYTRTQDWGEPDFPTGFENPGRAQMTAPLELSDKSVFDRLAAVVEGLLDQGWTTEQMLKELRSRNIPVGATALAVIFGTEAVWKIKKEKIYMPGNYVYIQSEPQLYTVGFYDPSGRWNPESDQDTKEQAADRVRFLNGGNPLPKQTDCERRECSYYTHYLLYYDPEINGTRLMQNPTIQARNAARRLRRSLWVG